MNSEQTSNLAVACNLSAFDSEQSRRHDALATELLSNFQTARELPDGYEVNLPGESAWYLKLAEWVILERLCCPFLNFEQGFNMEGKIWLRLTGGEEAKQFLHTYVDQIADNTW